VTRFRPLRAPQHFPWSEIARVARPRFGIPNDAVYIVARSGRRMMLVRSLPGTRELVEVVRARGTNVAPMPATDDLVGKRESWRSLAWAGVSGLAIYGVLKLLYAFVWR
jgi:hypothetical protein